MRRGRVVDQKVSEFEDLVADLIVSGFFGLIAEARSKLEIDRLTKGLLDVAVSQPIKIRGEALVNGRLRII